MGSTGSLLPKERGLSNPLESCLSPTGVITTNIVTLGQTVWAQVGSQKLGMLGACPPWEGGVADHWKQSPPPRVNVQNIVVLCQNIWALVGDQKNMLVPHPLGWGPG